MVGGGVAVADKVPLLDAIQLRTEGAVLQQLGVEAAVEGVIDLLGHHAVERGADGGDDVGGIDGELRDGRERTAGTGLRGNGGERDATASKSEAIGKGAFCEEAGCLGDA